MEVTMIGILLKWAGDRTDPNLFGLRGLQELSFLYCTISTRQLTLHALFLTLADLTTTAWSLGKLPLCAIVVPGGISIEVAEPICKLTGQSPLFSTVTLKFKVNPVGTEILLVKIETGVPSQAVVRLPGPAMVLHPGPELINSPVAGGTA